MYPETTTKDQYPAIQPHLYIAPKGMAVGLHDRLRAETAPAQHSGSRLGCSPEGDPISEEPLWASGGAAAGEPNRWAACLGSTTKFTMRYVCNGEGRSKWKRVNLQAQFNRVK